MIPAPFSGCAAWLHEAEGARGAVLLPSYGYEELCGRHALRCLADRLASRGIPTLRFDYRGAADSLALPSDPDPIAAWLADAAAAIDRLKEATDVHEVALVGLRMGALLAPFVGARQSEVSRLVLLAPPVSGASYLRELRALSLILGAAPEEGRQPIKSDDLTVAGFCIDSATAMGLRRLDLMALDARPAERTLLLAPEGTRGLSRIAEHWAALGVEAIRDGFPGYQEMICDPTASLVPGPALDRVADWLASDAPAIRAPKRQAAPTRLDGGDWIEQGVAIGHGGAVGIWCAPPGPSAPRRGMLFLNAGGIHHAGWARMNVAMARRLAQAGVASLRLDFPGVGDAAAWPGPRRMTFYDPGTQDHVIAALDWLAGQGVASITIAGACSGAHHAFHAAVRDRRVDGLVMLNTLCFVWGPGYALPLHAWKLSRPKEVASRQRIAEGGPEETTLVERAIDASLPLVKQSVRGLLEALKTGLAPLARRRLGADGSRNEVEGWFRALSSRGVRIALVYGEDDPGRIELERHMGRNGERATALPGVSMHLIPDTDHALTSDAARARYSDIVMAIALDRSEILPESAETRAASRAATG